MNGTPPIEDFYSALKKKHLTEDEYTVVRNTWRYKNMKNLYDLLVWYNNLDVAPFQTAIAKYVEFFWLKNIDVFKTDRG